MYSCHYYQVHGHKLLTLDITAWPLGKRAISSDPFAEKRETAEQPHIKSTSQTYLRKLYNWRANGYRYNVESIRASSLTGERVN